MSPSVVNGRSSNNKCHSYRDDGIGQVRKAESGIKDKKAGSTMGKERKPTCNRKMKDRGQEKMSREEGRERRRQS